MKEVLQSIQGFSFSKIKKKTTNKKMSASAAINQAHEGAVDLESQDSILGQVNLRMLLNKSTFSRLPPEYQYKLSQLLPQVDLLREPTNAKIRYLNSFKTIKPKPNSNSLHEFTTKSNLSNLIRILLIVNVVFFRVAHSGFNNEFFAKACQEWKERLLKGDFTPESLLKLKSDVEKDKNSVDPWKVSFKNKYPFSCILFHLFFTL